jgi:hypothetical protein
MNTIQKGINMTSDAVVNRLIKEKILKVQEILRIDNGMEKLPPEDIVRITAEAAIYHILTVHFLMSDTFDKEIADKWLEAVLVRVSSQIPDVRIAIAKTERAEK